MIQKNPDLNLAPQPTICFYAPENGDRNSKESYQSAYLQIPRKSLDDACFVKLLVLWIPILQNNHVGLKKVTAHSTAF